MKWISLAYIAGCTIIVSFVYPGTTLSFLVVWMAFLERYISRKKKHLRGQFEKEKITPS